MGRHGLTWVHRGNNTLVFNDSHHRSVIPNNKSVYYRGRTRVTGGMSTLVGQSGRGQGGGGNL